LICLFTGQMSMFILLGLVLFLYFERDRPLLAGACLWLCLLKPQLFVPCMLVMFAWIITTRRYAVLAGALIALGAATVTACYFDPLVFQHYLRMVHAARLELTIPSISITLRRALSPTSVWVQYIPAIPGSLWALNYFRIHRKDWDWREHGLLLVLVSVLVAPYTWILDQVILIPSLLRGAYRTNSPALLAVLALANAIVNVGAVWSGSILHSFYFIWTIPCWLVWYLLAIRPKEAYVGNSIGLGQPMQAAVEETA